MNSAELLSAFERCPRIPFWAKSWKPRRMRPVEMLEAGVRAGLLEQGRTDYGEVAGEEVYGFGSDPGIDSQQRDQHSEVVHLACIADIVTSAIRTEANNQTWKTAPDLPNWKSGCYLSQDGTHLRRIAFVTSWNDDRHYSLCRSWESIGEIVHHNLPMQLIVVILGQHLEGKYHSYWTHGLRHPTGHKKIRFCKRVRQKGAGGPFGENWKEIWREDYADISTDQWLNCMLEDRVLEGCLRKYDIPLPKTELRQYYVDLAQRKLEIIRNTTELPMQQLSTCDHPIPCRHRDHCHAQVEPGPVYGFMRVL